MSFYTIFPNGYDIIKEGGYGRDKTYWNPPSYDEWKLTIEYQKEFSRKFYFGK